MRISDWSSDVCSSDLLRARKTDLLIGLSDGRAVAVEAKDSASVLNSVKRVLNDTAAKARYWDSQCGKTVVRSEEHTSELQSLMRNSYAVFCLKKKKIIITKSRSI